MRELERVLALSKHEAVTRLCESLASCVADNQATSAGAPDVKWPAGLQNSESANSERAYLNHPNPVEIVEDREILQNTDQLARKMNYMLTFPLWRGAMV